ncbi:MAG: cytochrome c oxidase assembly protein, partial [Actinomycetota bacterium]|nr:cytochrome c oxidase assembly protein [Actinomycetota bacterium]
MLEGWSTAPWLWIPYLAAAAVYSYGIHLLHVRGRRWSRWRSLSFLSGVVTIAVALVSPLSAHDEKFSVPMVQHILLGMLGP